MPLIVCNLLRGEIYAPPPLSTVGANDIWEEWAKALLEKYDQPSAYLCELYTKIQYSEMVLKWSNFSLLFF